MTQAGCSSDVGTVENVDVAILGADAWYLEYLVIHNLVDDSYYEVMCRCWFSINKNELAGAERMRHLEANTLSYLNKLWSSR